MNVIEQILLFWFDELTPDDHFKKNEELDMKIHSKFHHIWIKAAGGGCSPWEDTVDGALALIICLDQFPRNMLRGEANAFHSDALAREVANRTIEKGYDLQLEERKRLFIYMPLMHSEWLSDQDRCVHLIANRLSNTGAINLLHARAHRQVIKDFKRFPFRNEALGRENSLAEEDFFAKGGYAYIVKQLSSAEDK